MQSAQVVTLKSGQQNASSVDSKSPMHSFELRTSSTLPLCSRVTSKPEVIALPVGLVPINALVMTGLPTSGWSATRKQSPAYDFERWLRCEPNQFQSKGQH